MWQKRYRGVRITPLASIDQMFADHDRKRQEIRLAPWQLVMTSMAGGAAFFRLVAGP
jgi:hypothetical protein